MTTSYNSGWPFNIYCSMAVCWSCMTCMPLVCLKNGTCQARLADSSPAMHLGQ